MLKYIKLICLNTDLCLEHSPNTAEHSPNTAGHSPNTAEHSPNTQLNTVRTQRLNTVRTQPNTVRTQPLCEPANHFIYFLLNAVRTLLSVSGHKHTVPVSRPPATLGPDARLRAGPPPLPLPRTAGSAPVPLRERSPSEAGPGSFFFADPNACR